MNRLWSGMLLLGIAYGAFCGKLPEVTDGALRASKEAVVLAISLLGVTGLWSGLMEIARKAGMIDSLVKKMGPVMRFLFPKVPSNHPAIQSAATNMICNVFGLGAAATPPGLLAMEQFEELEEERRKNKNPAAVPKGTANREMCTFLILNISSLQLIPVNVIAYRSQYGSVHPTAIVGPALAMPPVVVFNLGSGRGAAPPSLITTSTSAPGNASRKSDSAWFLIFTANGSRALAKRSTTVTLPSADAVCSINPLETMSCPVSGWTTDASRRLIFSSIVVFSFFSAKI